MKDLLSVIVPVYNAENEIRNCVYSILQSEYENLEVILINDGSKDRSGDICDELSKEYKTVKVCHQPNKGVSSARNSGILIAQGDYIAFVDSDDWVHPKMYSECIGAIRKDRSMMATCGYYRVNEKHEVIAIKNIGHHSVINSEEALKKVLEIGNIGIAVWDKVFKKELLMNNIFPEDEHINEEIFVLFKSFIKANRISFIGEPYYYYMLRHNSVSQTYTLEKAQIVASNLLRIESWIHSNSSVSSDYVKKYNSYFASAILQNLYRYDLVKKDPKLTTSLKKYLVNNFRYVFFNKNIPDIFKLKSILLITNLYYPIYKLRRLNGQING